MRMVFNFNIKKNFILKKHLILKKKKGFSLFQNWGSGTVKEISDRHERIQRRLTRSLSMWAARKGTNLSVLSPPRTVRMADTNLIPLARMVRPQFTSSSPCCLNNTKYSILCLENPRNYFKKSHMYVSDWLIRFSLVITIYCYFTGK